MAVLSTEIVWQPTPEQAAATRLAAFMRRHGCSDYAALHRRSVEDLEWFWNAVVQDLGLEWFRPYTRVLDTSRGLPWTTWWIDGQYNYVHNCLDRHLPRLADRTAVIAEREDGTVERVTYAELLARVNRLANALRRLGVGRGDRVGIFMPMGIACVAATLAVNRIGAAYVPIFSGFAAGAVATRLQDAGAVCLITADGFERRGRPVAMKAVADEAVAQTPTVRHVVVERRLGTQVPWHPERDRWLDDLVAAEPETCPAERTGAEELHMLIYTSGTTGRPKGTVHVHGGFPIKATMDMAYGFDIHEGDVMFWLTDLGWMMGPWEIIGVLTLGATMVAYDGAIDHPGPDRLWQIIERHQVTALGISPTAVRALMRYGDEHPRRHDLSSLRMLGATGEPWNPEPWMWYFDRIGGRRCPVMNYTGGTEISGGILGCTLLHPQKPMAFTAPVLGMDADVYDEQGRPVRGAVGELVLRRPWPGMTRGFWQDPDRYLETYWSRWPDVWVHGDWAMVDEDGFWYILGRSDDTIKVAGKRVGPAEVESAVVAHPAVSEAAAVGVPDELKGEAVVVFAVLRPGVEPSDAVRREIRETVVAVLGKTLEPREVRFVRDLPKTRNAKIMRRVIRAAYLGTDPGDLSSLENPQAVEEIRIAV
ncbi:MAG: acetate--CoA ligase [Armatimonadota bacterium]|nr:acetate--CoA ligase [Armatimonadota bacterium]MDR7448164.1 acetate--CoA ligase [Armatimonadota bacterium]MDR7458901.1 acetate--CoA ligase [Armatimonadota bacterium]MDR7479188.1 acetate--CoA ligase [Armatimonadota bacterium]MDR7487600.1 acetate--CoA ligase [Armatimonadota bacterium]